MLNFETSSTSLPLFNWHETVRRLNKDTDFARTLIATFIEEAPTPEQLTLAWRKHDVREIDHLLCRLLGETAYVDTPQLNALLKKARLSIENGNFSQEMIDEIQVEMIAVKQILQKFV